MTTTQIAEPITIWYLSSTEKSTIEELSGLGQWFDGSAFKSSVKKWQVILRILRILESTSKEDLLDSEQCFGNRLSKLCWARLVEAKRGIKEKEREVSGTEIAQKRAVEWSQKTTRWERLCWIHCNVYIHCGHFYARSDLVPVVWRLQGNTTIIQKCYKWWWACNHYVWVGCCHFGAHPLPPTLPLAPHQVFA